MRFCVMALGLGARRGVVRRALLGLSALGLAALALGCRCGDQADVVLELDPSVHFQAAEGFGTSINAWAPELVAFVETPEFRRYYLEELGATALRVDLHGDAVPERERADDLSYRDYLLSGPGERAGVYLRVAQALTRESGAALRVVASVWSPPAWMKQNGALGNGNTERKNFALADADLGVEANGRSSSAEGTAEERQRFLHQNKLRRDRYVHFARSLVEWARLYREHGVDLYALSPQNEPRFSHWFGSCVYTPTELADVVRVIEQTFREQGEVLPRLFAPETMSHDVLGNRAYLDALLRGPNGPRRVHALAVHGYVDGYATDRDPASPRRFAELAAPYGRAVWFTEGGTGGHDWPEPLDGMAMSIVNAVTSGGASLLLPWQVADKTPTEHALRTVARTTKKSAVARHFARVLRPGMRRIGARVRGAGQLEVVAFEDASTGEVTVVALNRRPDYATLRLSLARSRKPVALARAWVTDRTRDFAELDRGDGSLRQPPQSIVTLKVRTH